MLRNYLYIDKLKVNDFYNQIEEFIPKKYQRRKSVGFSIKGPSIEISEEDKLSESNLSQKINILENFLDKNHLVDKKRPNDVYSLDKDSKKFVLESMVATKIIFPYGSCCNIHGLKDLAVWISDPDPQEVITENVIELPYTYTGTFLYLTEMYLDNKSFFSVFSGCSALQAVVNYLQGRSLLTTVSEINTGEFFGRSNYAHPVDKLLSIGAIKSCTKRIISLYYKRYITDEQCFIFNGERSRVNDLLGYPLYIAEKIF